ncbi:MAG: hypothetical protein SVU32_06970 [Candidatus Nanohaloarchaea archaeon]|nr:hypothetical protein [Candidatus Nanohaloarchaea archaeon]
MTMEEPGIDFVEVERDGLEQLVSRLVEYCDGAYGDRCRLSEITILRETEDQEEEEVHRFAELGEDVVATLKKHLDFHRDKILVEFRGEELEYRLRFTVYPPGSRELAEKIGERHVDGLGTDSLVVVAENVGGEELTKDQKKFLAALKED